MSITIRNIKYEIIKKLGVGGSGSVFLVKNKKDNKYYALKEIIIKEEIKDKYENIQKEANILYKFNCENIVKYYGSQKINNKFYIIMEYCAGNTLKEFIDKKIKNNEKIEENEIYNIIKQICAGIKEIHNNNIIHRDLKPENIFINEKMEIKIGDFGISKQFNPIKEYAITKNKAGSILYMAPEILIEGKYNEKSDMYSLGCIIYELFNLSIYYDDRDYEEIKKIDSYRYTYNKKWQEIIDSLLEIDSNKRMNINQVNDIILKYNKRLNKRLIEEFRELSLNPISDIGLTVGLPEEDNLYKWRATLMGAKDTSYKGGLFYLEINFPIDYPNNPPEIHFLTPIYHPNVDHLKPLNEYDKPLGHPCFSTVNCWKYGTTIRKVLTDLYAIFYWPNPYSSHNSEAGNELISNRDLYEEKVRYFTKKYASLQPPNFNPYKYCDKNWDFSYIEKDSEVKESSKLINQNNIENNNNNTNNNTTKNENINNNQQKEDNNFNNNNQPSFHIQNNFINKYNNKNDDNEKICLLFENNNGYSDINIECELEELTEDVFKRYMVKAGLEKKDMKDILFIFNVRKLFTHISIHENYLKNGSRIKVIYDVVFG